MPRVFTERGEVPLVTVNLCVMRRYNLGEWDLVFTYAVLYAMHLHIFVSPVNLLFFRSLEAGIYPGITRTRHTSVSFVQHPYSYPEIL